MFVDVDAATVVKLSEREVEGNLNLLFSNTDFVTDNTEREPLFCVILMPSLYLGISVVCYISLNGFSPSSSR